MGNSKSTYKVNNRNTLLNIFVCNSNNQINSVKFIEEIENKNTTEYKIYCHKFYGWTFYDYGNELNEGKIKIIRNNILNETKNKNFKNVIICFVSNSNNNNDLLIMESIAEIPKLKGEGQHYSENHQPLLLYISSFKEKNTQYYRNKLRELLNKNTEKYKMDELNITSFFYNEDIFNNELINELWQMTIYYNQLPSTILPMSQNDINLEVKFDNSVFTLNLLLAGKSGVGKSTFINILKGRKIAYQSDLGNIKTNKINDYIISIDNKYLENYPILSNNNIINNINNSNNNNNLLFEDDSEISTDDFNEIKIECKRGIKCSYQITDTLGFSTDNKEAKELLDCIENYNKESIKNKDRIQCILYFIKDSDTCRVISGDVIKNFLKFVIQQRIKIIFIINFNNGKDHECKEHLLASLNGDFTEDEYNFLVENDESNIIEVCLKNYKGIKPFGLDKLMEKLENYFKNKKVNTKDFKKLENISLTPMSKKKLNNNEKKLSEYLKIMRKSPLFNDLNTVEDLYIKFISKSKKIIIYCIPILIGISFVPIPGLDDAIALSIESGLIAAIGNCFGINMTKEEIKNAFINVNFGSSKRVLMLVGKTILRIGGVTVDVLKLLPPLGTIIAGGVSAGINVGSIKLTGNQAISYFLEKFIKEVDYNYLVNMSESYNNNINGFTYLKEYFKFIQEN